MLVKYKNKLWDFSVTRNMPFWHQFLSSRGYATGNKMFGIGSAVTSVSIVFNWTRCQVFFEQKQLKHYYAATLDYILKNKNLNNLEKRFNLYSKKLLKALYACDKNLSPNNLNRFQKQYGLFCAPLMITFSIGRHVSAVLREEMKKTAQKNIDHTIAEITYPDKHTPLFISQLDMLKIGKIIQSSKKKISKEKYLKIWLKKYLHIPVNYCEEPWNINDAKRYLNDALKNDCAKRMIELHKIHKNKIKKKKEILKSFPKKIQILANALADATYLNEFRKQVFCEVSLNQRGIFKKISKLARSNNWRDCFYLTPDEMVSIVKGEKIDVPLIVCGRKVAGMTNDKKGNVSILDKKSIEKFVKTLSVSKKEEKFNVKEIQGISANKGIVRGIVCIVHGRDEFNKFKRGNILLAPMTSVDYVPIMEKAAAFVTNEGGITSHASIVSREMNKPCIIGTKIATKVLKDGDMVEVDANTGIVKLLK